MKKHFLTSTVVPFLLAGCIYHGSPTNEYAGMTLSGKYIISKVDFNFRNKDTTNESNFKAYARKSAIGTGYEFQNDSEFVFIGREVDSTFNHGNYNISKDGDSLTMVWSERIWGGKYPVSPNKHKILSNTANELILEFEYLDSATITLSMLKLI